ncbi:hypothetical protein [Brachyspira catarrhinii]|uniref:hypothetical protein n=1 Tax=Brachyspira catarrhinii TaxID=2528966 RepID=UPI0013868A3F|nr:hypothetical protein [Brachyspira catarrhinii]
MIETTLFWLLPAFSVFIFILILLVISFTAICYAIEEGDNDKDNKRIYRKNEEVEKDL